MVPFNRHHTKSNLAPIGNFEEKFYRKTAIKKGRSVSRQCKDQKGKLKNVQSFSRLQNRFVSPEEAGRINLVLVC